MVVKVMVEMVGVILEVTEEVMVEMVTNRDEDSRDC